MKQKFNSSKSGFTLIEMLVVISIMGVVAAIFIVNFAALRAPQNLRIAQNELITNIRKIQSYTLSSRNSPTGKLVKLYFLQLRTDPSYSQSYQIRSVNSDYSVETVETVNFPKGVSLNFSAPSPMNLKLEQPVDAAAAYPACMQIAYGAPFAKSYLDGSCSMPTLAADASKLVALTNSRLTITLISNETAEIKTIIVNGVSGTVCAPVSGNSC